jgi:excisionase family DNA binding protein
MSKRLFTTDQAAAREGVSWVQVGNWIRSGYFGWRLPAVRLGRTYGIREADLDRLTALRAGGRKARVIA